MSFFGPRLPAPPARPSYRNPEWIEAPQNVVPASVALDVPLVRRPDLALWIAGGLAFPSGLSFDMHAVATGARAAPFLGLGNGSDPRVGVLLGDGRKVPTRPLRDLRPFLRRPDEPVLRWVRAGGSDRRSQASFWLWPLPPPGPLTFVCAWAEEGVEETRGSVDSERIRAAAGLAVEAWPDERPLAPSEDEVVI